MDRIFWGMAFVLLDIEVTLGTRAIGLLPDWLGWWWLAKGFLELETEWKGFRKRKILLGIAMATLLLYGMRSLELTLKQRFVVHSLEFLATAAAVAAARYLIPGIRQLEVNHNLPVHSDKLTQLWLYLAVLQVLKCLLGWLPLVGTGCTVAAFAMGLCWLAVLWKAKQSFPKSE